MALLCVAFPCPSDKALAEDKFQLWGNNKGVDDIVTGTLLGQPFTVERGDCSATSVVLRDGRNANGNGIKRIAISFAKPIKLENSRFIVTSGSFCQKWCSGNLGGLFFLFDSVDKFDSFDQFTKPFWST